jgi:RNA polymerase sigma factor (sigma-70 family)
MSRLQDYEATGEDVAAQTDLCVRLRDIIPRLPPRERTVIELLLEGKSQAVIAHMLEVCEGTVSRLRGRATAALRNLLAE